MQLFQQLSILCSVWKPFWRRTLWTIMLAKADQMTLGATLSVSLLIRSCKSVTFFGTSVKHSVSSNVLEGPAVGARCWPASEPDSLRSATPLQNADRIYGLWIKHQGRVSCDTHTASSKHFSSNSEAPFFDSEMFPCIVDGGMLVNRISADVLHRMTSWALMCTCESICEYKTL